MGTRRVWSDLILGSSLEDMGWEFELDLHKQCWGSTPDLIFSVLPGSGGRDPIQQERLQAIAVSCSGSQDGVGIGGDWGGRRVSGAPHTQHETQVSDKGAVWDTSVPASISPQN